VEKEVTDLVGAEVKRRGGRFCWLRAAILRDYSGRQLGSALREGLQRGQVASGIRRRVAAGFVGCERRRVVDVEKDEANSVGGSDVDSRRRAAGNLEVLKVELKQIVARPYIKTKSVC